ERPAAQQIRAIGLHSLQRSNILCGHVLDASEGLQVLLDSARLQPIQRLIRAEIVCQGSIAQNISGGWMDTEEGSLCTTKLNRHQGIIGVRAYLPAQPQRQPLDRRFLEECRQCQTLPKLPLNTCYQ